MNFKSWQKLFLCCLGLFLASAVCMKWLEGDFMYGGQPFSVIGLEVTYSPDRVRDILSRADPSVLHLLRYHLRFDFVFMAGAYPGIASLAMMASGRHAGTKAATVLKITAPGQLIAWVCDIRENLFLLGWIQDPSSAGDNWLCYHTVVWVKWVMALTGFCIAVFYLIKRKGPLRY